MKKTFLCVFALMGMPSIAMAANCVSDTSDGSTFYVYNVTGFSPPVFDPNAVPIGGIIYSSDQLGITATNKKNFYDSYRCSIPANLPLYFDINGIGTPINQIYPTSIPNIGMRLTVWTIPLPKLRASASRSGTWNLTLKIELIKTGEITAGGMLSGTIFQLRESAADKPLLLEARFAAPVNIQPRVPTCQVATPSVTVPMGTMTTSMFTGPGSTTFARHFEIALACSGGAANTSTHAHVTLTDASLPGNISTTLSLTKESTASGIGVQIRRDDKLLGFGPDSDAVGNTNQWYMGNIVQGTAELRVPLTARYVQTGTKVGAGSANARATFTLSYQ
ncbi:fimbrial protein [Burkholderia gladioli]|uniref:fimbrial protein n=1 Tax=Burkholderia gladioli TaxID=28095 RepID=UPI003F79B89C